MFGLTVTERCHRLLAPYLREGDTAVDCTAGNGHDTVFLAERTGPQGTVYAFEIQENAAEALRERCAERYPQVRVVRDSHTRLAERLEGRNPSVILYNLGYLPGGDHRVTTVTEDTIASLEQAVTVLRPGGVLSVIAYPGHPEGAREAEAVEKFLSELPSGQFEVLTIRQTNRSASAPVQHLAVRR